MEDLRTLNTILRISTSVEMVCPIQYQTDIFEPTKQVLLFHCDICSLNETTKGNIALNSTCRRRLLNLLQFVETCHPTIFQTERQDYLVSVNTMKLLKEYADILSKIEINSFTQQLPELKEIIDNDPIQVFELLEKKLRIGGSRQLSRLYSELKQTKLYLLTRSLLDNSIGVPQSAKYELLFDLQTRTQKTKDDCELQGEKQLVDSYYVGPFEIRILDFNDKPFEKFYHVIADLKDTLSTQIIQFLSKSRRQQIHDQPKLLSLDEVLSRSIQEFHRYLSSGFQELSETEQINLAIFATTQSLNLTKTMPLLLDDEVQEFYLDKPGDTYYLDHSKWGRCRSNLAPTKSELSRLVTRLRLESRHPLDERTPSLKTELKSKLFHVRVSVDIPPLAHEGIHLNVRKLRLRLLTLPELIELGTLSSNAAAFLILCMTLRLNITICGEPASGKTTLANAINLLTPPFWRRIAIEDALESISVDNLGRHKVTFKVDPFDSFEEKRNTKSNEIVRLLHRSPDWVFLGEIQTAEHSSAMFHALSAGIKGIQTCHANSNDELLLRWKIHHKIPEVCFHSLGLLVHMKREIALGKIIRRVVQISEIKYEKDKPELNTIFEWNKRTCELEQLVEDIITPLIKHACKFEQITDACILERFSAYKETLEHHVRQRNYDPVEIIHSFDDAHRQLLSAARTSHQHRIQFNYTRSENYGLFKNRRQDR